MTLDFTNLVNFAEIFVDTLNKHAPTKKKYIGSNHPNVVTEALRKAIMLRSRLQNIFLKKKSLESTKACNKKRNICVKMVKKARKEHYQNISLSEITDNKKFWKTISCLFVNKVKTNQKVNLIEKSVFVIPVEEIAKT